MLTDILRTGIPGKIKLKKAFNYFLKRNGARKSWKQRHGKVGRLHPHLIQPFDPKTEKNHLKKWTCIDRRVRPLTFRICSHLSGSPEVSVVPEEIYQADIEPTLNRHDSALFQCHKSFYNSRFEAGIFPADYLHSIDGEIFDSGLNPVQPEAARKMAKKFQYPLIMKPNAETRGGKSVQKVENQEKLIELMNTSRDYIVQEKIRQHTGLSRFHSFSLNTIRVDMYKSVFDNRIHLLHAALRMGKNGSLDNLSSGGIVSYITKNGDLHGYALDKYGQKYRYHPDTNLSFTGQIPGFEQMQKVALSVSEKLFLMRTFSLDLCLDEKGRWRVIEINPASSIRFAQYAGQPFFKEFTDEVIEYCLNNHWALKYV